MMQNIGCRFLCETLDKQSTAPEVRECDVLMHSVCAPPLNPTSVEGVCDIATPSNQS